MAPKIMRVEVQRTAPDECSTNLSGAAPSVIYQQIAHYYNNLQQLTRWAYFFFAFFLGTMAPDPHVQTPCPLPKMPINAHCDCRFASSVALRGASRNAVSVIGYSVPV